MKVGDSVRVLKTNEEGIVKGFLEHGKVVEVSISEDFDIPYSEKDLVLVCTQKRIAFNEKDYKKQVSQKNSKATITHVAEEIPKLLLAFSPINEYTLALSIINNGHSDVLFTLGKQSTKGYKKIAAAALNAQSCLQVYEFDRRNITCLPVLVCQVLYDTENICYPPLIKKVSLKAAHFSKKIQKTPLIGQKAYLFPLNHEPINHEFIVKNLTNNTSVADNVRGSSSARSTCVPKNFPSQIDLHAEKLIDNPKALTGQEILEHQVAIFKDKLDEAIPYGQKVVFIHGVGNGILREKIREELRKHPHVLCFQDAPKEQFGNGATLVKFK